MRTKAHYCTTCLAPGMSKAQSTSFSEWHATLSNAQQILLEVQMAQLYVLIDHPMREGLFTIMAEWNRLDQPIDSIIAAMELCDEDAVRLHNMRTWYFL